MRAGHGVTVTSRAPRARAARATNRPQPLRSPARSTAARGAAAGTGTSSAALESPGYPHARRGQSARRAQPHAPHRIRSPSYNTPLNENSSRVGRVIPLLLAACVGSGIFSPAVAAAEPEGGVHEADRRFSAASLSTSKPTITARWPSSNARTRCSRPTGSRSCSTSAKRGCRLRDYAAALSTFEHYLGGAARHRSLAEANIKELRPRVSGACASCLTVPPGAEGRRRRQGRRADAVREVNRRRRRPAHRAGHDAGACVGGADRRRRHGTCR